MSVLSFCPRAEEQMLTEREDGRRESSQAVVEGMNLA
jgi:hypothetical protein